VLTREIMGALTLAILWVNALLIAAAALRSAGEHRRRLRTLREVSPNEGGTGLFQAQVDEGAGQDDGGRDSVLARYELEQLGRAGAPAKGRRTVHFGDRTFDGAVLGGVVVAGDTRVRVSAGEADVWPSRGAVSAAAACSGQAGFDRVFDEARKARGHARKITVDVRVGQTVWLGGELRKTTGGMELVPSAEVGLLVSAIDPRAWLRHASALAAGFALAEVLIAGAITALVLVPPVLDGWPSKLGGVLGLAFFLAVQPLGTAVRDAVRTPGKAFVRGRWIEPGGTPAKGTGALLAPPA